MGSTTTLSPFQPRTYIRVSLGDAPDGESALYEVDRDGWVHRHVHHTGYGLAFAPEDILFCERIKPDTMLESPHASELTQAEFEFEFESLRAVRPTWMQVPDPSVAWRGWLRHGGRSWDLLWAPNESAPAGWCAVPGYTSLFVDATPADARRAATALFCEGSLRWAAVERVAA